LEKDMTPFAELEELLARKNQRFACKDLGWPEPGPERFVARISHEVAPPLSGEELDQLRRQIPSVPQLAELYSRHGSIRLYCDTIANPSWGGHSSAFYIAHPDQWEDLAADFGEWLVDLDEDERTELLPEWIDDCVVIGEVPNSGNYFLVPLAGSETGSVFEFEHDGFEFIRQADSIAGFIGKICTVTDALLREIAGHTRYCDGKSDIQWLVERYEFD
jgi:hypothetical protein